MIQQAFISGQIGKVIYAEDDRYFLLRIDQLEKPVECRPMDMSMFFNYGAEFITLSGEQLDLSQLRNQLIAQRQAYRALTMVISGLDGELDEESRQAAIEDAEGLFRDAATRRFVRARMLARPLPTEADIEVSRDIAIRSEATSVGILYQSILDCEQAITLVHKTWMEAGSDYFASQEEHDEGERILLELGVFADMAQALARRDATALSSIIITYGQRPELNNKIKQGTLILNDLRSRLSDKWDFPSAGRGEGKRKRHASGEPEHVAGSDDPVHEILAQFKQRREHPKSRTLKAHKAKEKVDHQIEAIGKHIRQGNIGRADRFLRDLINFHVEHSEREHLGMSLCALAKIAIDAGAFELAEQMVNYALMLGIDDVVISNTQAETFKAMGRFDDALTVYRETIERFPNNEVARGGYAEVLKAMGRFDDALTVYRETIERFSNDEVARNGYASVLMLMNRFSEVPALLPGTRLSSKEDWIAYHIVAMSYLRSGEIDEAIRRLAYGLQNNPWVTDKFYFANALALAKIKKRQFDEVLEVLPTNVIGLDVFQKQTRLVLVGHSQAALGKKEEAAQTLAQLEQATNPRVIGLKEAIARRYDLKRQSAPSLSPDEEDLLEKKIYEEEFFLAMAA
ncbi:MAG TPA: tetratricopeptide repeat protein [Pyrinomonadaceae bacterium]|nr:tetratricopeptide repeat protein [Pyrinomonadaceae bacterium]